VYVEKGSGKLKFAVYGFNWERHIGRVVYSGELPIHGKKVAPDSLTFHETASRSVTPEWRAMDGSLCKVKIGKFPAGDPNSKNIMITGGVEDLGCIEPAKKTPTIQKGPFCSDPVIWSVFPSAQEMGREKIKPGKKIRSMEDIAVIYNKSWGPGIGKTGTSTGIELNLFGSPNHAKTVWDLFLKTMHGEKQPLQIGQEAYIIKRSRNLDHGHNSVYILHENMHIFAVQTTLVSFSPKIKIVKEEPNLDGLKLMIEKIKALRCSLIPEGIKTGMEARIEEIRWKGTIWPVRLQEGKLEVRGSGYAAYQWRESWITVSCDVIDFKTSGSGAGPIVAYTTDGSKWHIVTLNYASGAQTNKRRFPDEITHIKGGRNGATIQAGEKCYDYSLGQLREINCQTRLYK